ncbi:phage tail tape measure protein [Comamonas kerstersii]|uniref:phage tail tape measure protein n=1 Tax=Comamonas kerstersii TaxID=225992 RepID=UPI000984770B|nr:phage tail tape measure protein [Comamonas kerstersii]OOH92316.1 phage tail tape measure protein [Comamonas kerstersii]
MERIGITLGLDGADKVRQGLSAVRNDLGALGPASQTSARAATASLGSMQMSAAQTSAALRMVPAQFTDIVVSLQSGQQPLTVLLQQGGQLKDMFGGIVPAAKALGGYVAGLISPITLLAGGIAALGVAYYQGSKEQDAFNQALIMTGNRAGVTAGQLAQMAQSLGGSSGFTKSAAAAALAELAATGKVGAENMERFAATAMELEQRVGIPVQNTVKDLAELGKAPVEASIKLNQQYGYLTTATLAMIKALRDEGREADAAALAQKAYANAMSDRTKTITENLGYLERGWNAVANAARKGWDAILGIGRPATPEEKLAAVQTEIVNLERALASGSGWGETGGGAATGRGMSERKKAELRERLAGLRSEEQAIRSKTQAEQADAAAKGKNQAIQDAGIAAFEKVTAAADRAKSKQEQLNDALTEYRKNLASVRAARALESDPTKLAAIDAQLNPAQIAKTEAAIRQQFAEKSGSGTSTLAAARRAELADLQATLRQEQALLGQRKQQLDIQYSAGLVSMEDYYRQQRGLIEQSAKLEEAALQSKLQRLEQEKTKGADALNVQRQIADVQGQLAVRRIQTQNELAEADQRAAKAVQQHAAALAQLNSNYTAYVNQLQSRANLQVASVGMGQERAAQEQGLLSIRENYAQQMRNLEDQRGTASSWTAENERYYQERMRLLKQQQEDEVRIHGETYERIQLAQADWQNGAIKAMEDYMASTRNVAQSTANLFSTAFKGMEDSLVSFVTTGKGNFKSLANTIVSELIRIQMQEMLTKSIGGSGGLLGSVVGAVAGLFGGAAGTASSSSSTYSLTTASNYSGGGGLGLKVSAFNAKGGVYDSPSLSMYRNQVLSAPTLFAFAKGGVPGGNLGLMGEAGPEAIVPLARMPDGNLGVRTQGGANGGAPQITYAPKIHVDARSDASQVYTLVRRAVREGQVQLLEAQSRGYSI